MAFVLLLLGEFLAFGLGYVVVYEVVFSGEEDSDVK